MATVKYLAIADFVTGEIQQMSLGPADLPPEGVFEQDKYLLYVYEDLLSGAEFMETHYVDVVTGTFIERPKKFNPFCYWENFEWKLNYTAFLNYIRRQRNEKLSLTDWTQIPDASLTETQKLEAATYRQALRDLTNPIQQNPEDYLTEESIPWPTPPSFLNIEI